MDLSQLQEIVDLSQFSAAECGRIWDVLQRDFQVRFEETRRLNRIQSRVAQANEKINLLGEVQNFNEKYCVVCFGSFVFIINPSYVCYACLCNVCKKCSRFINNKNGRICSLCEEEKYLVARKCSWFYDKKKRTFVVNDNPTALTKDRLDGSQKGSERGSYSKRSSLVPNGTAIPPEGERDENEEALKRITGMQIMRFQQKMNAVATEVRTFLRNHICYEIPEAGVDRHYDKKMKNFNEDVIDILRNFSQTLYIAIEGYHSRTGKPLRNVHQEVLFILQDEVENLVGYRVDVAFPDSASLGMRQDDDIASTVSEDDVVSSQYGPGNIQEKLSRILMDKWIADHQIYLDDQRVTASDLYTQNALEDFLNKKANDHLDYRRLSLDDDWHANEDIINAKRQRGIAHAPPAVLNEVDPDMLSLNKSSVFNEVDPDILSLRDSRQMDGSVGSSNGTSNWLLKGRPSVSNTYGESMHHFDDSPSPRVGRRDAYELSDELSDQEDSEVDEDEVNSFLSQVEEEHKRKKSHTSIDFDDIYNSNLNLEEPSADPVQDENGVKSEDSGVHVNGNNSASPLTRHESVEGSESSGRARKISLGFLKMDWSFSERSDPCFISKTTEVSCKVAECASITVEVDGTMPIDVYWYRASSDDLVQLEESDRIEFVSANDHPGKHTLHVWHVEEDDEGEYLAVAVNQQGSNKQGFKISVLPNEQPFRAPEFQRFLSSDEVMKAETARMRCKVSGYPHPRVVFTRNNERIPNNEKYQLMRIGERAYTLSIHNVEPDDIGVYKCTATNAAGKCQSEGKLSIASSKRRHVRINDKPTVVDNEDLVDTSPAVNVRSQVKKLGSEDITPGSTLFIDKVEPLTKPSIGDFDINSLPPSRLSNSLPRRRQTSDGDKMRPEEREKPVVAEQVSNVQKSPAAFVNVNGDAPSTTIDLKADETDERIPGHDLVMDLPEEERLIDCGLKPVSDSYKRDFRINRPASAPASSTNADRRKPATSTAKRIELKPRKSQEALEAPIVEIPAIVEATETYEALPDSTEAAELPGDRVDFADNGEIVSNGIEEEENHYLELELDPSVEANEIERSGQDGVDNESISMEKRKAMAWNPWISEDNTDQSLPAKRGEHAPKRREKNWRPNTVSGEEIHNDRRNSVELEEAVSSLKQRFERGINHPHQPNPEGSIPKQTNNTSSRSRRNKTLPARPYEQPPEVPKQRSSSPPPTTQPDPETASSSFKDKVVVPEFFHVKLKPTGRQIND